MAYGRNEPEDPAAGTPNDDCYDLRLFVSGCDPRCLLAYANLKTICREHLRGRCRITVVDLARNPEIARREQITAVPTLIRAPFVPGRVKIVGTLADRERVLAGLSRAGGIHPADENRRGTSPAAHHTR